MQKIFLAALIVTLPASAMATGTMTVATFLQKTEALQSRGALALLSSDTKLLKAEVVSAGQAVRAEQAAARKAGRAAPFCLPESASTDSRELLRYFGSMPPAQRVRMNVRAAFRTFVIRKYPCS